MTLTNKEKAVALLTSLETGDKEPVSYINAETYKQHNLSVGDGLQWFAEALSHAPEEWFKANVVRSYEDEEYVFLHTEYDFFGPKIWFDVFKFEDGLIVEHWDNLTPITPPNPSWRTQIDGFTDLQDAEKTQENKNLVRDFVQTILIEWKMDTIWNYFDWDEYVQHNSLVWDWLSWLWVALQAMAEQWINMVYNKIHKVLWEWNFVLVISEWEFAWNHTSYFDLFRIENGKIREHWDVIETILPKEEHKHLNGKFWF